MAKNTKTENIDSALPADTITINLPADLVLRHESGGIALPIGDVTSPEAIAYLLQYGFSKSLQDSVAGKLKVFLAGVRNTSEDTAKGLPEWKAEPMTEDEAKVEIQRLLAERADDIRTGSVTRRAGGPRLRGIDWYIREVAKDFLAKAAAAKGKKLPAKAADLQPRLDAYTTKNADKVRAEAQRRMDADNAAADTDEDDILDGLEAA